MRKDRFITVMAVLDDQTQEIMESIAQDFLQQYMLQEADLKQLY